MNDHLTKLPTTRIRSLDIIRGIALFGILLINVHFFIVSDIFNIPDEVVPTDTWLGKFISIFIEKKFYSIFSFLFGVGFFIFATKAEAKGWRPLRLFSRRLFFLFVIGILHLFFFLGSILSTYALIALFILPFYRRQTTTVEYWLSGGIFVFTLSMLGQRFFANEWYFALFGNDGFLIWLMFLTGLWFGKKGLLLGDERAVGRLRTIQRVTAPLFVIAVALLTYTYASGSPYMDEYIALTALPMASFYLSSLFLVLQSDKVAHYLQPIGYVGRMAFTNYLLQNIIGVALIYAFHQTESIYTLTMIALLIYIIQVIYSTIYFRYFNIGPFESIWRKFTYRHRYKERTFPTS